MNKSKKTFKKQNQRTNKPINNETINLIKLPQIDAKSQEKIVFLYEFLIKPQSNNEKV